METIVDNIKLETGTEVIMLFGEIDTNISREIVESLLSTDANNITLLINSIGGNLDACVAIINAMQMSGKNIKTIGMGSVCSSALLVFLAGNSRVLFKNAHILSHQASFEYQGKPHEVASVNKHVKHIDDWMINFVMGKTKLSKAQVKKYLLGPGENWLSAEDCLKWGVADSLV